MNLKRAISNWFCFLPAVVSSLAAAGIIAVGFILFKPEDPVYEIRNYDKQFVVYTHGALNTHTEFCISEPTELTITRDFRKIDTSEFTTVQVSLPPSVENYGAGCYEIDRIIALPQEIPFGKYGLTITVSWQIHRIRIDSIQLPPLEVLITPQVK